MSAPTPTPSPGQSPRTRQYSLQVIRFEGATIVSKTSRLYAKVKLGDDTNSNQTQKVKGTSPSWNETFTFSSPNVSTRFNIRVKRTSFFRAFNTSLGSVDISIADLLERSSGGEAKLDIHPTGGRPGSSNRTGVIHLRLERTDAVADVHPDVYNVDVPVSPAETETSPIAGTSLLQQNDSPENDNPIDKIPDVRADIDNAISAIRQRGIASSAMGEKFATIRYLPSQLGEQSYLYKSLWALCDKIGVFADFVDKLAIAHPYLNAAWQVISSLFRVADKKFENDAEVVELVWTASEAFDFACEVEELPNKIESLQRVIIRLLTQTTELCIFVRHYASRGLAGQFLDLINNSQKTYEFKDSFIKIKADFSAPLALQAAFVSSRISEKVDTIYLRQELKPDDKAATGRPECLPGTRGEYLDTIMDWAFSDSEQNILWLYGVAGSGKSTISMTIAEQCSAMVRRGAYLYFEREKSDPNSVIRSIAFWLASFHHSIAKIISEAVKANNGIAKTSLARQFDVLLLQPLRTIAKEMIGPVVVVLDALDECGPPTARRELVKLLAERFPELPHNFRFIITGRHEADIASAFSKGSTVRHVKLNHESSDSRRDVATYFTHEMNALFSTEEMKQSLPNDWQWDANIQLLVENAGGLFVFASTAVKHISEYELTASPRLERLVNEIQLRGHAEFGLDALYSSVLESTQIPWNEEGTGLRVSNILYLILEVGFALSTDDIDGILSLSPQNSSTRIISRLQSVLAYTPGSLLRIRPLHASFAEFLKSGGQSQKPWYISIIERREYITKRCHESFNIMDCKLRFNICSIETSFEGNDCVPDLQSRIEQNIPSDLENACVYWIQQLRILPYSPELLSRLDRFIHNHLLSWLEVLSLKRKVDLATSTLVDTYKWAAGHSSSLESFLRDARKLVIAFNTPISKSLPHIYLSMLPLAWQNSEVSAHYSRSILAPNYIKIIGNRSQRAPLVEYRAHSHWRVPCISYSVDGKRIVSGSKDRTIRVGDAESGKVLTDLFIGHTDQVNSVEFSRDGNYVVSGSYDKSVIIWNAETGEVFRGPFEGHTGAVYCASFSPDGKYVVSGSSDSTIKVWEVKSGKPISATFEGHSGGVWTVAYSPDGNYIISGSDDMTLRVWGAQSGETVKGPFEGHTSSVRTAKFSFQGKRIVSGSSDNTIRVWNFESGKLVAGPFKGHSARLLFTAFSPNGKHIFSGSWDNTMKVWDVESGEIISSMTGERVFSIAFALDGKRVSSGLDDGTIRVFDVQLDNNAPGSSEGHTAAVISIAYSPDGKHIVSSSSDNTLIVWDVETGKVVVGPFNGHSGTIHSVAYSPNGSRIVSGSDDKTLIVWDAKTGEVVFGPFKRHTHWVWSVGFSPDGRRVVSGSSDKTIIVWDVETGAIILGPLEGHLGSVYAVRFSPDGKYIVSGSGDKTIRVWSAENGEAVLAPFDRHTDYVFSVIYSNDGRYIVSGSKDKTVIVWDAECGVMVAGPFGVHTDIVWSVSISPDGKSIASGSRDKTLSVLDTMSGKTILGPLRGHADVVRSVQFSPDGRHLASGSWDGSTKVWDVENEVAPTTSAEHSTYSNWTLSEDGWVLGHKGELLLWIPPDMRASLWLPRNAAVMNRFVTKLHFTERGIGENWHECLKKLITE